jgi:hypothetical protein
MLQLSFVTVIQEIEMGRLELVVNYGSRDLFARSLELLRAPCGTTE